MRVRPAASPPRTWKRVAIVAVVLLAATEATLWLAPGLLGGDLANRVLSAPPSRVRFHDRKLQMSFLRAGLDTHSYRNGYRWRLRTDFLGFRNLPSWGGTRIAILGDESVFGFGVGSDQTLAGQLRLFHSLEAYSMARPGDGPYEECVLAQLFLDVVRPDHLLWVVSLDDPADLLAAEVEGRLAAPGRRPDWSAERQRLVESAGRSPSVWTHLARSRALRLLVAVATEAWPGDRPAPYGPGVSPQELQIVRDSGRLRSFGSFLESCWSQIAEIGSPWGTHLIALHLDLSRERPDPSRAEVRDDGTADAERREADSRLAALLETSTRDAGIRLITTTGWFDDCERCFLPGDGHLSPLGYRRLADGLAPNLRGKPP